MSFIFNIARFVAGPLAVVAFLTGCIGRARDLAGRGRTPRPATYIWTTLFGLALVLLSVGSVQAPYRGRLWMLIVVYALITVCGWVVLGREQIWQRVAKSKHPRLISGVCIATIVFLATLASYIGLELPWNTDLFVRDGIAICISVCVLLVLITALFLLNQGYGVAPALLIIAAFAIGIVQLYVCRFRESGITPLDVSVFGTALEVAGGYNYEFDFHVLQAIAASAIGVTACALMHPLRTLQGQENTQSEDAVRSGSGGVRIAKTATGIALLVALGLFVRFSDLNKNFGIDLPAWHNVWKYSTQGFIPTFISGYQDLAVEIPEGYSKQAAEELLQAKASAWDSSEAAQNTAAQTQFAQIQPNVVIVMNESFCDLSPILGEGSSYTGPEFYNSDIDGLLERGSMYSSVYGGGTCNTEFEMFTSYSMKFLGGNKYPYVQYNLSNSESLVRTFKEMGYTATALHPASSRNYNRSDVYPALGFDEFIAYTEPFIDPNISLETQSFHGEVRDGATYAKVLDLLKERDEPQFIFDLTMQNHGPYEGEYIPEGMLANYSFDGLDEKIL